MAKKTRKENTSKINAFEIAVGKKIKPSKKDLAELKNILKKTSGKELHKPVKKKRVTRKTIEAAFARIEKLEDEVFGVGV